MSWLDEVIRPSTVCQFLSNEELYQRQRDRVAAVVHEGFAYYDKYQKARPYLFYGGAALSVGSAFMWYWRGVRKGKRGHRIAEAHALYPLLMGLGIASMWAGRPETPGKPRPTDRVVGPDGQPTESGGFVGWVDQRVADLRKEDPQFANGVFDRLTESVPGVWKETPEIARTFVTCGRGR